MDNGITINGDDYELVDIAKDTTIIVCHHCDARRFCGRLRGVALLCEVFDHSETMYFKLKNNNNNKK